MKEIRDVNTDQQDSGLREQLSIDRDTGPSRLGITSSDIDNVLYSASDSRQVSTIYTTNNQYHVVLYVSPEYQRDPRPSTAPTCATPQPASHRQRRQPPPPVAAASASAQIPRHVSPPTVPAAANPRSPLSAIVHRTERRSALVSITSRQFPAATISFQPRARRPLRQATDSIEAAAAASVNLPARHPGPAFPGHRQAFQDSLSSEPSSSCSPSSPSTSCSALLYESLSHPLTILPRCPRLAWCAARCCSSSRSSGYRHSDILLIGSSRRTRS